MAQGVMLFALLFAVWGAFSGHFSTYDLSLAAFFSAFTVYLAIRCNVIGRGRIPLRPLASLFHYMPWLIYQIVTANIDVAKRVLHPRLPISPKFEKLPLQTSTEVGTAAYANSITLTPGTVTVELKDQQVLVHGLTQNAIEDLRDNTMQERIKKLERNT